MELVGRAVKKTFDGFGTFTGFIESYDPFTGYFKILYEDGDGEEVEFQEITAILSAMGEPSPALPQTRRSSRCRRPKKRRRTDPAGGGEVSDVNDQNEGQEGEISNENGFSSADVDEIQADCNHFDRDLGGSGEKRQAEESSSTPSGCSEKDDDGGAAAKRRKVSGSGRPRTATRRSARKVKAPSSPSPEFISVKCERYDDIDEQSCSAIEIIKPTLPPPSNDLDLDGLPVIDLFSVYSCLRSFSRLLFLSPFRLETFVAVLRCKYSNHLLDSVHFAILQALKQHLEFLSREGSQWATCCLRNLNWNLLDTVTWPVYLAEYLLIRGVVMRSGFKLARLKLLDGEYYKQPAEVKLEILRCLCDDVIEVEAIRLEVNRRMSGLTSDVNHVMDVDRKLKDSTAPDPGSLALDQEVFVEVADGNVDECCLCRMVGKLICCDGCPAAFHARCVGVAKDLLPEGEWYCPECLVEKDDGLGKLSKTFRGAEILGMDPHGRLYYGSCGYVLVSDSCDADSSFQYFNKNDISAVTEVLKSSSISYSAIASAIHMYCGVLFDASSSISHVNCGTHGVHEDAQVFHPSPSRQNVTFEGKIERVAEETHCSPWNSGPKSNNVEDEDLLMLNSTAPNQLTVMACPASCSDVSIDMTNAISCVNISQQTDTAFSIDCSSPRKKEPTDLAVGSEGYIGFPAWGGMLLSAKKNKTGVLNQQYDPPGYVNFYCFGRIASSIAEELMIAASDINITGTRKPVDDIQLAQLKVITEKSISRCWYTSQKQLVDVQKEKCGWCFSCQSASDDQCLFRVADDKNLQGPKKKAVGIRTEKNKKTHLISAMHHILSIEERLLSLLSGPWESPHYSKCWRKAVMKATNAASLKPQLLVLELNLRRVALSVEWQKQVGCTYTLDTTSHISVTSVHTPSSHGGSRKQVKKSAPGAEFSCDSLAATSDIYWWRGGRLSCQVFQWNMLPRSLACKGARQAGCRKIPTILYPDGSKLATRSKCVAWRAAVEMSKSMAQLICQIKEFDSNIRWRELSNTEIFPRMAKESKKLARPLKNVTIRKKCIDEMSVKYLLDFGKRENIPASITKHGIVPEDSSDGRRKYWLNETHVPLNLLKAFEEKELAGLLKRSLSEKGSKCEKKKPRKSKGLDHLLSREEPLTQLCSRCKKNVLVREAMNCQFCNGFFHRKHFKVPKGAVTTSYTCSVCKDKRAMALKAQQPKALPKRKKKAAVKLLIKLPKEGKPVAVKCKKKPYKVKRGNQGKSKRGSFKKPVNSFKCRKRKRTVTHPSYWLNGLLWTRKSADELGKRFRENKVIFPSQHIDDHCRQPVCCLCQNQYNPEVLYICCESCGDWFHGDAYFLTLENINSLIGFKCHKCRMKSMPTCPFSGHAAVTGVQLQREASAGAGATDAILHKDKEEFHDRTPGDFLPVFEGDNNPVVEGRRGECLARPKRELILYRRNRATNGHVTVQ